MLQTTTGALLGGHAQHRIERQPTVPTPAAGQSHARNMDAATPTVHHAWLPSSSDRIQRVDTALRTRRAAWPGRTGQLAQPGRQELPPNFQHALFPCVEVSRRLIMRPRAESIDRVSCGCEHLLAEDGVQRAPPFGTAVLLTR